MNNIVRMVCYFSVKHGDCVVLKDAAGATVRVKALSIHYDVFARRVMRSKAWLLSSYGPGSFHFERR